MNINRRGFVQGATGVAAVAAGSGIAGAVGQGARRELTESEKLSRIASNTYPVRWLFPSRSASSRVSPQAEAMRKKYGNITLLDFPQFTKDTWPGVYHMDVWSSLFGDVKDESMFETQSLMWEGQERKIVEFDPATPSAKRWLDQFANKIAAAGTRCHHVSNNAPRNISVPDAALRKQGIETAKKWLDASATIGAKTMRVNSGGPRLIPGASVEAGSYPKNNEIEVYLKHAIDSFKEMADYGGKVGVKVTIENHWGLTADPTNIRIILDQVNSPWCEASPDFCNWEHEYMLYHGLAAVAPYAHTTVHAKYWDRWKVNDIQRSTRVMNEAGFQGIFALEYEDGPWDGVEGARHILKEVLAAL
ncbi:MAG: sugar phosphate isomerase/epimerase family protein [Bryobacterales bacterium]|nr:sugar phosphate isomerase/epimerase family protein [Bryobacterales bacterium]